MNYINKAIICFKRNFRQKKLKKEIKEILTKENTKDVLQAEVKGFQRETTSFREKEL